MVKRKTVRKVYKKSRRKSIKRISRKTKRGGKNSKKGIRTFKKKHSKKIKRTKRRKLNVQIRNNYIHVNKTVRIGKFKLRPGNKLNFLPQDRKYQEGGMSSITSLFRKVAPLDAKKEVCISEDALNKLKEKLVACADEGNGNATYRKVPSEDFDVELAAMKKWEPPGGAGVSSGGLWVSNENCDDLVLGDILGHGASGVVSKATFTGKEVAVKELNFKENNLDELRSVVKEFKAEVGIMGNLKHPNLVQLKGYCTKGDKYKFKVVLELIDGGTLYDKLHEDRGPFDESELLQYALDVAMGMEYLHAWEPPILHRDLKSPNIMVGKTDNNKEILKITDFGLARMKGVGVDMKTQVMTQAGTPYWSAPEVLSGKIYNETADVYSAAMVFYEIWARKVPFKDMDPMEVGVQVTTKDATGKFLRPELEADSLKATQPCPIIELVEKMWDDDPVARPTFPEICDSILATASKKGLTLRDDRKFAKPKEIEFDW
jgi:hypothetical protein